MDKQDESASAAEVYECYCIMALEKASGYPVSWKEAQIIRSECSSDEMGFVKEFVAQLGLVGRA